MVRPLSHTLGLLALLVSVCFIACATPKIEYVNGPDGPRVPHADRFDSAASVRGSWLAEP
jgi:hypothetical protein